MGIFADIETQIEQRLKSELEDTGRAEIHQIHTDDVAEITEWVADNMSRATQYPQIMVYCGAMDFISNTTTMRGPGLRFDVSIFIAYSASRREDRQNQKRVVEETGLRTIAVLSGHRVYGEQMETSEEPLEEFSMDRIYNFEEAALYEITCSTELLADLDVIKQNIS
jgi:hypothetical protein